MSDYIFSGGELYHYGVKGMKWGVRRYQNKDGSLTPAGKKHQAKQELKQKREEIRSERKRFTAEEYNRLRKQYDISGKENAAYEYGRKHGLDLDDGGGGSEEAGRKYWQMQEDVYALDQKAIKESQTYARQKNQ